MIFEQLDLKPIILKTRKNDPTELLNLKSIILKPRKKWPHIKIYSYNTMISIEIATYPFPNI